jgi:hypothetical protein
MVAFPAQVRFGQGKDKALRIFHATTSMMEHWPLTACMFEFKH